MSHSLSIDLVICTYNNARLLKRTLKGIAELKVPTNIKSIVLVVDNNCTDNTAAVVQDETNNVSIPVRIIKETRQGLTPARVCGVSNTNSDWIAFIDDDCILETNWLEEAGKFIITHPQCGLFGGKIKLLWEKEPPSFIRHFPFAYAAKNHGDTAKRLKAVAGAGMIVKREALKKSGWLTEQFLADRLGSKLVSGGDMEISLRVGTNSEVWYNPAFSLLHIIPEQRTTKKYLQRIIFGLGASRHNLAALGWDGSYFSWCLYASAYSVGMLAMCLSDALLSKRRNAGLRVVFSPYFGWCAAMRSMFRMDRRKRNKLLGCIKRV